MNAPLTWPEEVLGGCLSAVLLLGLGTLYRWRTNTRQARLWAEPTRQTN